MAEECGELVFRYGVSSAKIHVITNAWQLNNKVVINKRIKKQYEKKYVISYVGLVNAPHRGVDIAIKALSYVRKSIPEVLLLIVGDGKLLQSMKELVAELKLEHYVAFTGWVPFDYVPTYISLSRVGLLPLRINDHTDTTLPHKLFQYMALGRPVVASTARAMGRIINQTNTGYLVPPEDPGAIAEAIIDLYRNPEKTNEMGNNGIKCVKELYNWESEFVKLNNLYLSLQSNIRSLE
jgi:glycosyltransferase involved in cell wall biosynthesis